MNEQKLAQQAIKALAEGDFDSVAEIKDLATKFGYEDLASHLEFILSAVTEEL